MVSGITGQKLSLFSLITLVVVIRSRLLADEIKRSSPNVIVLYMFVKRPFFIKQAVCEVPRNLQWDCFQMAVDAVRLFFCLFVLRLVRPACRCTQVIPIIWDERDAPEYHWCNIGMWFFIATGRCVRVCVCVCVCVCVLWLFHFRICLPRFDCDILIRLKMWKCCDSLLSHGSDFVVSLSGWHLEMRDGYATLLCQSCKIALRVQLHKDDSIYLPKVMSQNVTTGNVAACPNSTETCAGCWFNDSSQPRNCSNVFLHGASCISILFGWVGNGLGNGMPENVTC